MPIDIHGKDYATVAERVDKLRKEHPEYTIETQLIMQDEYKIIMKALILDGEKLISTGYAEEIRGSSPINKHSPLENAETSAVGRAAAFMGYAGTEIASAEEVANANYQQDIIEAQIRGIEYGKAQILLESSIAAIKEGIAEENLDAAAEAWFELTDDEKKSLWIAPSKGGCFTTREREVIKSTEFREAYHNE